MLVIIGPHFLNTLQARVIEVIFWWRHGWIDDPPDVEPPFPYTTHVFALLLCRKRDWTWPVALPAREEIAGVTLTREFSPRATSALASLQAFVKIFIFLSEKYKWRQA
jgi:hypothetical protein